MSAEKNTGQRVFSIISMIFSGVVLVLAVVVIIGAWWLRGPLIQATTGVLSGVEQLSQAGQQGVARLDSRLADLRATVGEVNTAVDQIAQNVEDRGLIVTLLPPEKEQQLQTTAQQLTEGVAAVRDIIQSAVEFMEAVNRLPFVSLPTPEPERVAALEESVTSLRAGVEELQTNVRQFREGASNEISRLTNATSAVDGRLETAQTNLAGLNERLVALESRASQLRQQLPPLITTLVVVITLVFAWVIYAMVVVIRQARQTLRG